LSPAKAGLFVSILISMILIEYNFVLMKAYISISYNRRKSLNAEVNGIKETLLDQKIESFVFVDEFRFNSSQENEMMQ